MAKNKQRMAQNRAKKRARVSARKKRRQQPSGSGFFSRIGCTRNELGQSPVHGAYVSDDIFERGIGHAIIARKLPDGRIAVGVFLIDVYCLGVKDAFLTIRSETEFADILETRFEDYSQNSVPAAYARKLIDDSIAYARDLGLEPHPDFRDASLVLGDIDPTECSEQFTFGRGGKPFYISGPYHSEATARRIIAHLMKRCGPDGADYLVSSSPFITDAFDPEESPILEDGDEDVEPDE